MPDSVEYIYFKCGHIFFCNGINIIHVSAVILLYIILKKKVMSVYCLFPLHTPTHTHTHTHTHTQGDSYFRYFEVTDQEPYIFFLNQTWSNIPQCGACVMPQHNLDYLRCEVMRFYRLQHTKGVVEPMPMIVPRKVCVVCVV